MDFSPLVSQVWQAFWVLVPLILVVAVFRSPWFKGVAGEFAVNAAAKLLLDKQQYRLLSNVTLPTENGTTQIDHIVVSQFGLFVIETKNMKGWIFGSPNQAAWTQKIYRHTTKFQNPLRQNYKHVKALEAGLDLPGEHIHSLVVFVGDCAFKTTMPDNVTQGAAFARYIKSFQEAVLSEAEVTAIVSQIESGRLEPSFKTHREHVQHVRALRGERAAKPRCPRCSSEMVLRTAKAGPNAGGKFWGCSQFPKCRGVVDA